MNIAWRHAGRAGIFYFATVFVAGFALGTIRTLFLVPRIGEFGAVIIELPFMLAASWLACTWILRRMSLVASFAGALVMGLVAFACLMLAEFSLAALLLDQTPATYLNNMLEPAGLLGLIGQMMFAAMPAWQLRHRH